MEYHRRGPTRKAFDWLGNLDMVLYEEKRQRGWNRIDLRRGIRVRREREVMRA